MEHVNKIVMLIAQSIDKSISIYPYVDGVDCGFSKQKMRTLRPFVFNELFIGWRGGLRAEVCACWLGVLMGDRSCTHVYAFAE